MSNLNKPSQTDLTFITNEEGQSLLERFKVLIRDTEFFDALAGYFYSSGFHALYKPLEKTKQIRILIGIGSDRETANWIQQSKQPELPFSHTKAKDLFSQKVVREMDGSEDSREVYEGVIKFIEWLRSGKLKIRVYPARKIHAKLYIMSFAEGDRDRGRVITGSGNFTRAGLTDNLEFNVELKNPSDYGFALQKFNELWRDAVDVKEAYLKTVQEKTWLNDGVTPYQLYLKFLYEHFKEDLRDTDDLSFPYRPPNFKRLEYQNQAVQNAKRILEEYGGVFLSDVVGLGKTYMSALLAGRLDGRSLVLAPPLLLDEANPGSWRNVFSDFQVPADFESLGKLDNVISRGTGKYKNVFIDEAHRFRRETNITYEKLARICRGKRVVLVTATPLNNTPSDILSQIKLFQSGRKSAIPNVPHLDRFFGELEKRIKNLNKRENSAEYIKAAKENADKIRESVLKYLMVRRTRTEIEKYFADDLARQNVKFPEVKDPEPFYYQLNKTENEVFHKTARLISQKLKYARYAPLIYYKRPDQLDPEIQAQKNLGIFMKILLVKRLESSFCAFRNSIRRFISSYELFLKEFEAGSVYVSKDYSNKIFELLSGDNEEAVQKLIDEEKAKKYPAEDFTENLEKDLKSDLEILNEVRSLWSGINRDPKLLAFKKALSAPPVLYGSDLNFSAADTEGSPIRHSFACGSPEDRNPEVSNQTGKIRGNKSAVVRKSSETCLNVAENLNKFSALRDKKAKLIVFTESKETAEYLGEELSKELPDKVLVFTGSSASRVRQKIIADFDPKAFSPKNDCRILIATDVLSEGVNLHRSHVIVNYDLPWNPTRLMQRAGRINRVDTSFDEIHVFNFFPTEQSNDIIRLEETAKAKIAAFINLLGADARFLTEEEVPESHALFGRLGSKRAVTGEDGEEESALKYLKVIKDLRDKNPDLFSKIKQLPKKARTARKSSILSEEIVFPCRPQDKTPPKSAHPAEPVLSSDSDFILPSDFVLPSDSVFPSDSVIPAEAGIRQKKQDSLLLTYFRQGKLNKFCVTDGKKAKELDFMNSAKLLEAEENTPKSALPVDFFSFLEKNKEKFLALTSEEEPSFAPAGSGRGSAGKLLKILKIIQKDTRQWTEDQEAYFKKLISRLEEGALPKKTVQTALKHIQNEIKTSGLPRPLKILALLQKNIPDELLTEHISEKSAFTESPREVILSEYLIGKRRRGKNKEMGG